MEEKLVTIEKFNVIKHDERGVTAEFLLPRAQQQFIFITRKANTVSGNAYHEGQSDALNPKVLILVSGSIRFAYRKINTDNITHIDIDYPAIITIQPYVIHKVEAITDCIFLECNAIADIEHDRFKEEV